MKDPVKVSVLKDSINAIKNEAIHSLEAKFEEIAAIFEDSEVEEKEENEYISLTSLNNPDKPIKPFDTDSQGNRICVRINRFNANRDWAVRCFADEFMLSNVHIGGESTPNAYYYQAFGSRLIYNIWNETDISEKILQLLLSFIVSDLPNDTNNAFHPENLPAVHIARGYCSVTNRYYDAMIGIVFEPLVDNGKYCQKYMLRFERYERVNINSYRPFAKDFEVIHHITDLIINNTDELHSLYYSLWERLSDSVSKQLLSIEKNLPCSSPIS